MNIIQQIETPEIDFDGLIDDDVMARFKGPHFFSDIINAQLIKTNKQLIEAILRHKVEYHPGDRDRGI